MADENTYGFNRDDAEALLQSIGTSAQPIPEVRPRGSVSRGVILDAALAAVTNPKMPTAALATVCEWSDVDEEYTESAEQITVYNHSFTAYAVNTMGAAIVVDGHYWFFGDCVAMDAGLRT